jgi:hypothetical protein
MGVILGLAAALLYGGSDFAGGQRAGLSLCTLAVAAIALS